MTRWFVVLALCATTLSLSSRAEAQAYIPPHDPTLIQWPTGCQLTLTHGTTIYGLAAATIENSTCSITGARMLVEIDGNLIWTPYQETRGSYLSIAWPGNHITTKVVANGASGMTARDYTSIAGCASSAAELAVLLPPVWLGARRRRRRSVA